MLGISGGYAGQSVPIPPQGLVVGRDATVSQLLLAAEGVSRRHATLVASAQGLILTDQQSSNGTYLEQEGQWVSLQGARTLQPGDKVSKLGQPLPHRGVRIMLTDKGITRHPNGL